MNYDIIIIGGGLGFMLGGPLGAIIGGALGSNVEIGGGAWSHPGERPAGGGPEGGGRARTAGAAGASLRELRPVRELRRARGRVCGRRRVWRCFAAVLGPRRKYSCGLWPPGTDTLADSEERMLDRFTSVTRATLKGTAVIGIVQGALAGAALPWV